MEVKDEREERQQKEINKDKWGKKKKGRMKKLRRKWGKIKIGVR